MEEFSKKQLLIHYLLGLCTSTEQEEIENWLAKDEANVRVLKQIAQGIKSERALSSKDKKQLKKDIFEDIAPGSGVENEPPADIHYRKYADSRKASQKRFYQQAGFWAKVAAVILVFVIAAIGAHYYANDIKEPQIVWQERTLPYGQTTTLRFNDGSVIKVNGGSTLR